MSLPPVSAAVTAEAVAALPTRLRARLDPLVDQARTWPAERSGATVTVHPDDNTTVTLTIPVTEPADARCSCLLAPRCLHRAAVLSAAPIDTGDPGNDPDEGTEGAGDSAPTGSAVADDPGPPNGFASGHAGDGEVRASTGAGDSAARGGAADFPAPGGPGDSSALHGPADSPAWRGPAGSPAHGGPAGSVVPGSGAVSGAHAGPVRAGEGVSGAQVEAARGLWVEAAALLGAGIPGAGAVAQADLLRAVHQARAVGLHAAAAAAVRVVEQVRAARRDEPGFRLGELTSDVRELLGGCHRLGGGDGSAVGVARREYAPVGDLRLFGLFSEPVRAVTGHAGAVTYLADAQGRVWVVSDVKPAAASAARSAVRASVDLGEVRLSHHDLARGGLRAINAHASVAGRLSHGRARQAVAAAGSGWFEGPLDSLWQVDLAGQVDRWLAGAGGPAHERTAGHDLAFLDGVVLGADRRGLLVGVGPRAVTVAVTAPHEDPDLPYVSNLRLLAAHASGRPVRLAGRFTGGRRVAGLAFAAEWLPDSHGGHVDLGAARLRRTDLPGPVPTTLAAAAEPVAAPLHLVRHQLERVVAGGRAVLLSGVEDDARRLAAAHLGAAAAVVRGLGAAGVRRTRDVFGRLDPHDTEVLARAWLTAAVHEEAATRELTRSAWSGHG